MPTPLVIDLSHYNVITNDLSAAQASGIVGVIHKATDGYTVTDPKVAARFAMARNARMLWGIYAFLRPGNMKRQADYFTSRTTLIDEDTLLCCDFEVPGIPLDDLLVFLQRVEENSGQKPVLYSGHTLKEAGGASKHPELAKYRLWLSQYGPLAVLPNGWTNYWLWQYSEKGTIPGIEGNVDLNTYSSSIDLKDNWVQRISAAATIPQQSAIGNPPDIASEPVNNPPQPIDTIPPITISNIENAEIKHEPPAPTPQDTPVEVKKETPSLFTKIGVAITTITGLGINAGALIQKRLEDLTTQQLVYLGLALGLVAFGIWWYQKAAKGAQARTMQLVEKAADPAQNTVELKP